MSATTTVPETAPFHRTRNTANPGTPAPLAAAAGLIRAIAAAEHFKTHGTIPPWAVNGSKG